MSTLSPEVQEILDRVYGRAPEPEPFLREAPVPPAPSGTVLDHLSVALMWEDGWTITEIAAHLSSTRPRVSAALREMDYQTPGQGGSRAQALCRKGLHDMATQSRPNTSGRGRYCVPCRAANDARRNRSKPRTDGTGWGGSKVKYDREEVRRLFLDEGLRRNEVAERIGAPPNTVSRILTELGIPKDQRPTGGSAKSELCAKGLHDMAVHARPQNRGKGRFCQPCRLQTERDRRARKKAERKTA